MQNEECDYFCAFASINGVGLSFDLCRNLTLSNETGTLKQVTNHSRKMDWRLLIFYNRKAN